MFTEWKWTYTLDVEDEVHIINMGVYGQAAFKNDFFLIFFFTLRSRAERAIAFGWGMRILEFFFWGVPKVLDCMPHPLSTFTWKFVGGGLVSTHVYGMMNSK